jgi:hypothetical protein
MISQIIEFLDYNRTLGLSFVLMSNKLLQASEDNVSTGWPPSFNALSFGLSTRCLGILIVV